jgi:hypothetical protein
MVSARKRITSFICVIIGETELPSSQNEVKKSFKNAKKYSNLRIGNKKNLTKICLHFIE